MITRGGKQKKKKSATQRFYFLFVSNFTSLGKTHSLVELVTTITHMKSTMRVQVDTGHKPKGLDQLVQVLLFLEI